MDTEDLETIWWERVRNRYSTGTLAGCPVCLGELWVAEKTAGADGKRLQVMCRKCGQGGEMTLEGNWPRSRLIDILTNAARQVESDLRLMPDKAINDMWCYLHWSVHEQPAPTSPADKLMAANITEQLLFVLADRENRRRGLSADTAEDPIEKGLSSAHCVIDTLLEKLPDDTDPALLVICGYAKEDIEAAIAHRNRTETRTIN